MDFYVVQLALLATLMTWGLTALGGAMVFAFRKTSEKLMSFMFGFGAGVMIAASFFSLLLPGIDKAEEMGQNAAIVLGLGVLVGTLCIYLIDRFIPHLHLQAEVPEGKKSSWNRKILLVLAITLHNIPEGLAIGVAFGSCMNNFLPAWILAIGIGLQNFPEGMAVSLPLREEGMSRGKAFFYGQASGIVEPISAVIGAILVTFVSSILPFVLGFAAGAMIYVVAEELIPSGKTNKENKLGTIGVMLGFVIMMSLDLLLG
ncbi:MAG: ZIP family metal transporter [Anaeroplasma bactoclasticum]|nr:ZIP family metal transporter [Anaeroplasma bactoclasticum]